MNPFLFRSLVILNLTFAAAGGAVDWNNTQWEPVDASVGTFEIVTMGVLGLVLVIAAIVISIGLYKFWWWARPVALWMTILGLVVAAFGEPAQSALADAFYVASYHLGGAALAAAYWSEISIRFERKA